VGDTGLEHTGKTPQKQDVPGRAAQNPAHLKQESDLADLARRLAALPEAVRASIVDMLTTCGNGRT